MRPVPRIPVLLAFFLFSALAFAQQSQTPAPQRDPQAIAIAANSISSMTSQSSVPAGGVVATGTVATAGIGSGPLPIVLKSLGPRTFRSEIQMPKGLNTLILNNGRAAIERPDGSVKWLQLYNTMAFRAEFIPSFSLLAENADSDISIRKLDDAVIQRQPADVVELNLESGSGQFQQFLEAATRQRYLISKTTGLVLALEYDNLAENDSNAKTTTQILYSDYRLISGLWVPFHQETYSDGKLESTLVLNSVSFGSGVSATDFDLPARVKP